MARRVLVHVHDGESKSSTRDVRIGNLVTALRSRTTGRVYAGRGNEWHSDIALRVMGKPGEKYDEDTFEDGFVRNGIFLTREQAENEYGYGESIALGITAKRGHGTIWSGARPQRTGDYRNTAEYERLLALANEAEELYPAIKDRPSGKVFTGPRHYDAVREAIKVLKLGSLGDPSTQALRKAGLVEGFVNGKGEFLTRAEVESRYGAAVREQLKRYGTGDIALRIGDRQVHVHWNPAEHPREPAGRPSGGQFTEKGTGTVGGTAKPGYPEQHPQRSPLRDPIGELGPTSRERKRAFLGTGHTSVPSPSPPSSGIGSTSKIGRLGITPPTAESESETIEAGHATVLKNPTPTEFTEALSKAQSDMYREGRMRGILDGDGDFYVWSASEGIHNDIRGEMEFAPGRLIMIRLDMVKGVPIYRGGYYEDQESGEEGYLDAPEDRQRVDELLEKYGIARHVPVEEKRPLEVIQPENFLRRHSSEDRKTVVLDDGTRVHVHWNPADHPRVPAGHAEGGEFTSTGGTTTKSAPITARGAHGKRWQAVAEAAREKVLQEHPRYAAKPTQLSKRIDQAMKDAKKFTSYRDWYARHKPLAKELYGKHEPMFEKFLAATSINAEGELNVGNAVRATNHYLAGGKFDTPKDYPGVIPAIRYQLMNIQKKQPLTGRKIVPFEKALMGDWSAVPMDRHMARLMFPNLSPSGMPSDSQFAVFKQVTTEIANQLHWQPAELQAVLWCVQKSYEEQGLSGKIYDYREYLLEHAAAIRKFIAANHITRDAIDEPQMGLEELAQAYENAAILLSAYEALSKGASTTETKDGVVVRFADQQTSVHVHWNPADHPREPKGTPEGGEFAPKGSGTTGGGGALEAKTAKEPQTKEEIATWLSKAEHEVEALKAQYEQEAQTGTGEEADKIEPQLTEARRNLMRAQEAARTMVGREKVLEVGGDEWNQKTARRLEQEYEAAAPEIAHIADAVATTEYDEEAEAAAEAMEPTDWDSLSGDQQTQAEDKWISANLDNEIDYQQRDYLENVAPEEVEDKLIKEFNAGGTDMVEWADEALTALLEEETERPIPYTKYQLYNALTIKSEDEFEFDESRLREPEGYVENPTLPGITPENPAERLTPDMREQIIATLKTAFETAKTDALSNIEYPDYLVDNAKESLADSWSSMDDDEKFKAAQDYLDLKPEETASESEAAPLGMPATFDPLDEKVSAKDYAQTQRIARHVSLYRAADLLIARKLAGDDDRDTVIARLKRIDKDVWTAWKRSSTAEEALIMQAAVAEELGGRLRFSESEVQRLKVKADERWPMSSIGGFNGLKAYVRAKWETTQWLLEKADRNVIQVYRTIGLNDDLSEVKRETVGPTTAYVKLTNLQVQRNGAASTTLDRQVANNWSGDGTHRVVLRARVPRTAVISVPAYGINVHEEHEVVVTGTAWMAWDAWDGLAPSFDQVPLENARPVKDAAIELRDGIVYLDILAHEIENKLPHWLSGLM